MFNDYLVNVESAVHVKSIGADVNRHREKQSFIYDRVPLDRIDQYQTWRLADSQRDQSLINKRFPELERAREEYLG